jgi:DNA-binding SARP family transcriptional activator
MTTPQRSKILRELLPSHVPARSMPSLRIQVLGGFTVSLGDRAIDESAWRLRKAQSLVKLLALAPGHRLYRERVMELLWPDLDLDAAANNLHYALHVTRSTLAHLWAPAPVPSPLLRLRRQILALDPQVSLWVDVDAFEAAAAHARRNEDVMAYEAATALYVGELLPGDQYDVWTTGRREGLRKTQLELLWALAERYRFQGAHREAMEALERVLALEPAHEETHVALMQLHAEAGQRHQAIRQYERLRETLLRELDTSPAPASQRLYADLLAGRLGASLTGSVTAAATQEAPSLVVPAHQKPLSAERSALSSRPTAVYRSPSGTLPLIGREHAMDCVRAAWAAATVQPYALLVTGEAGIGKTRVTEETVAWAADQGIATAQARCYAAEGALPFAPVAAWLRTNALWPGLLTLDALWQAEVVRIAPDLLVERPEVLPPAPITESWQRQRLFEALARAALAHEQALLLVLDDLQWCDRETLEWLRYLLRWPMGAPLLVAGTLRSEEVGPEHPVVALLSELRRVGQLTEIELGPLDAADTAALAAQVAGQSLAPQQAAWLHAETEGNPLFVVQLVRAGVLDKPVVGPEPGRARSSPDALPSTVQAVIEARLRQLSPAARELAGLAATIGREFSFELLARASPRGEDSLLLSLEELFQRRIVREQMAGSYDFSHDKLREVAYAGQSATRRRALHRRVAQALEAEHAGALDEFSSQIATHYLEAGQPALAVSYLERAGDRAWALFANVAAEGYYRALVVRLDELNRPQDAARAREKLSEVLSALLRLDEALDELERAVSVYQAMGDRDSWARAMANIGLTHMGRGTPDQGMARLRSVVGSFIDAEPSPGLARLYLSWTYLALRLPALREALASAERAVQIVQVLEDQMLLHRLELSRGVVLFLMGQVDEGLAIAELALSHFRAADDPRRYFHALFNVEELVLWSGDVGKARRLGERAIELAEHLGSPEALTCAHADFGQVLYHAGEWSAARVAYTTAEALMDSLAPTLYTAFVRCGLGLLGLAEGHGKTATHLLEQAVTLAERTRAFEVVHWAQAGLAERDLLLGRPQAARARLDPLLGRLEELDIYTAQCVPFLAWAYLDLNETERAQALLRYLRTKPAGQGNRLMLTNARRIQALVAMRAGDWDEAVTALDEALSMAHAMPYPYAEAKALSVYGRLHWAVGEPKQARVRFTAALAILNRLGERLYANHVEQALAGLQPR